MSSDLTLACAVALSSLREMGPARINALRTAYGFDQAWQQVREGGPFEDPSVQRALGANAALLGAWSRAARNIEPEAVLFAHRAAGVAVHLLGDPSYPEMLATDIDPPPLLFSRGHLAALTGPRVAIVGTRRCTQGGRLTAREMGHELADEGVHVVSGLALGIDGAAHEGALRSERSLPVIGVVATGLDWVYPVRHRKLWEAVADRGVLISEVPLGTRPFRWRFPARNRIIAALSDAVVVVESHAKGGALGTADEALRRDRLVMAIPGSVRSPAATGTNQLLHDGADPARNARDVMTALGFEVSPSPTRGDPGDVSTERSAPGRVAGASAAPPGREEDLDPLLARVLDQIDTDPTSVDSLVIRTGLDLPELALAVVSLEQRGLVVRSGTWLERVR